jgi:hypothetical protein
MLEGCGVISCASRGSTRPARCYRCCSHSAPRSRRASRAMSSVSAHSRPCCCACSCTGSPSSRPSPRTACATWRPPVPTPACTRGTEVSPQSADACSGYWNARVTATAAAHRRNSIPVPASLDMTVTEPTWPPCSGSFTSVRTSRDSPVCSFS